MRSLSRTLLVVVVLMLWLPATGGLAEPAAQPASPTTTDQPTPTATPGATEPTSVNPTAPASPSGTALVTATPTAALGATPEAGTPTPTCSPALPGVGGTPTATLAPFEPVSLTTASRRPVVALTTSRSASGDGSFEIRLDSEHDLGLGRLWWWASGTTDPLLSGSQGLECGGQPRCANSWTIRAGDAAAVTINARARDLRGVESDIASAVLDASSSGPRVNLEVVADPTDPARTFEITVGAGDSAGLSRIWWWVPDSRDAELRKDHVYACDVVGPCRRTWQVSTDAGSSLTIFARADNDGGQRSDIARGTIRLKNQPPSVALDLERATVNLGDPIRVNLDGRDDLDGIWLVELEATNRDSGQPVNAWELSCEGQLRCLRNVSVLADGEGTFTLRARVRDRYGAVSSYASRDVIVVRG
jgi:hypothetical protein